MHVDDHRPQHTGEQDDDLPAEQVGDDRDLAELDDVRDREELRNRYYGLLQELRVVLPGAQVLVAFLVTAPFATRFPELDRTGRGIFGIATVCSMLSVICMLSPAAFHRFGRRTARAQRLRWSIRLTVVGMAFLGVAMAATLWCVVRFVYGTVPSLLIMVPVVVALPLFWLVLPLTVGSRSSDEVDEDEGGRSPRMAGRGGLSERP